MEDVGSGLSGLVDDGWPAASGDNRVCSRLDVPVERGSGVDEVLDGRRINADLFLHDHLLVVGEGWFLLADLWSHLYDTVIAEGLLHGDRDAELDDQLER